jgi:methylated-DNA-[protein]-cysteine S-methyltransferase
MKEEELASKKVRTPYGSIDLRASSGGLFELSLNGRLNRDLGNQKLLNKLQLDIDRYFEGEHVEFKGIELDMSGYTSFERDVLTATRKIPFGRTVSYREIAEDIGRPRAFRAVGNALGKNRTAIVVPCHRVIQSDGELGGFGAGVEWKKRLLKLEGVL